MIELIATWLGEFYLLATIVLVAAILGMKLSRQPARRLLIARAAFVALVGSILLASVGASSRRSRSTRENPKITANFDDSVRRWPGLCVAPSVANSNPDSPIRCLTVEEADRIASNTGETPGISPGIISGFLIGSGSIVTWLGLGVIASARLRKRSRPATEALRKGLAEVVNEEGRIPEVVVCEGIGQPIAMGLARPTIVLPTRFVAEEPAPRVVAALAHEWGHLRNGDLRLLAVSRLLLPILYVHPLYIWLRRRVRIDQELLADALAAGSERVAYAEALLGWAKSGSGRPPITLAPTLGLWERTSQLGERIAVLLDSDFRVEPTPPRRVRLGVAALTFACLAGLSAIAFRTEASAIDFQSEASASNPLANHPADCPCCAVPPPSAFRCPEGSVPRSGSRESMSKIMEIDPLMNWIELGSLPR